MTIERYVDGYVDDNELGERRGIKGIRCDHCDTQAVEWLEQMGTVEFYCSHHAAEYLGPQTHGYVDE